MFYMFSRYLCCNVFLDSDERKNKKENNLYRDDTNGIKRKKKKKT